MRIEWQIKVEDARLLELMVDGEVWKEVHKASFLRKLSSLRSCSNRKELECCFAQLEEGVASNAVLRLLSARDYFPAELRKKLEASRLSDRAITSALEKFHRLGCLDEEALTQRYIATLKRKGKGRRYIVQKLKEKLGYVPQLPHNAEEESEAIAHLLEKRFPDLSKGGEKVRARAVRFLLSRGFDFGSILLELKKLDKSSSI